MLFLTDRLAETQGRTPGPPRSGSQHLRPVPSSSQSRALGHLLYWALCLGKQWRPHRSERAPWGARIRWRVGAKASQQWTSSIQSAKTRLGADCGSDHELLITRFGLKLKKVGKNTRPFRYDLNQIPYDYTVEVRNRFKGLNLIGTRSDRVPDELWTEVYDIVQETGIKIIPKKKKCKKAKWLSEEALQIAVRRREVKNKGEKER